MLVRLEKKSRYHDFEKPEEDEQTSGNFPKQSPINSDEWIVWPPWCSFYFALSIYSVTFTWVSFWRKKNYLLLGLHYMSKEYYKCIDIN